MSDLFPIMPTRNTKPHPCKIPWCVAELAYSVYRARHGGGQTLARIAERGGFGADEMDDMLPDWREQASEIKTLKTEHLRTANELVEERKVTKILAERLEVTTLACERLQKRLKMQPTLVDRTDFDTQIASIEHMINPNTVFGEAAAKAIRDIIPAGIAYAVVMGRIITAMQGVCAPLEVRLEAYRLGVEAMANKEHAVNCACDKAEVVGCGDVRHERLNGCVTIANALREGKSWEAHP